MKRIIVHQVNCQGVMGAGFAKQIRNVYPDCYEEYKKFCIEHEKELLGNICIYEGKRDIIINLFSQDRYGRNKRYTDYQAMEQGFKRIRKVFPTEEIIAPYMIGCGLAGGDWNIVLPLLKKYNITVSKNIRFMR